MIRKITITSINLDFKSEKTLIAEVVQRYISRLQHGDHLEPVTIFSDGTGFWLFDGFHRVKAAKLFGRHEVEAEILRGTFRDMEQQWLQLLETPPDLRDGNPQA